jgi:hypothetical protein
VCCLISSTQGFYFGDEAALPSVTVNGVFVAFAAGARSPGWGTLW